MNSREGTWNTLTNFIIGLIADRACLRWVALPLLNMDHFLSLDSISRSVGVPVSNTPLGSGLAVVLHPFQSQIKHCALSKLKAPFDRVHPGVHPRELDITILSHPHSHLRAHTHIVDRNALWPGNPRLKYDESRSVLMSSDRNMHVNPDTSSDLFWPVQS
jgi:hypothetical protein